MNSTSLQLELLDVLDAARMLLDAVAMGEISMDDETLENIASMIHKQALRLRAERFARRAP